MFKITVPATILLASLVATAPAFADTAGFADSPGPVTPECAFVAEVGRYVCDEVDVPGSLSGLQDGNAKKGPSIQLLPPNININLNINP